MDNTDMHDRIKAVKDRIQKLIEDGDLVEAKAALEKYDSKMPGDTDICSMRAVIHILEGSLDEAEKTLMEGLKKDSVQFDLLFNLAYIYELKGQYQDSADFYFKAATVAVDEVQKNNADVAINRLKVDHDDLVFLDRPKLVFFVKEGLDSFLGDIIQGLSNDYWVRRIIVSNLKQIDEGMQWADVCWFEWCDELVAYGSRRPMAQQKKIICRLHSYEAFTQYIDNVAWENIEKVIFVAGHIRDFVLEKQKKLRLEQTVIIPNGIDIEKYTCNQRKPGYNVAYVGYINYKKGPMLLLHTFKALHDRDNRYKLYIAGKFQDDRDALYFSQMVKEFGIENNVFFEGWQDDINKWLEDKNYILCTSLLESQNLSVMQAMCKGIKPIVHNFVGARGVYPNRYIWNTIDEAVAAVIGDVYEPEEYRTFVTANYSLVSQLEKIAGQISKLLSFRELIQRARNIIEGDEIPEELLLKDLTVLIPNYNRAKMLKEDLDRGFKLGNQPKMIVDDCSTEEREWLDQIGKDNERTKVIMKEKNSGVAESRRTGLESIESEFTTFVDDDNIMVCLDREQSLKDISELHSEASIVAPRYILNYYGNRLTIGYDRNTYHGKTGAQLVRDLAQSGEMMGLLTGGAVGNTKWMRVHASCPMFRVSEDFVMLVRMMADKPDMRAKVTEGLVFIRRFLDEGSTLNPNHTKLALSLLSQAVACYYCLKLGVADKDEILTWMKMRASLLQRLYDFGESFETELIAYLTGEINEEVFGYFLELHGLTLKSGLDELAPELRQMRALLYKEPNARENSQIGIKDLPLVSIIIPTFNRCDMLKRAVDSALKQDYGNLEVVVMDNCSQDGTEVMVRHRYINEKRLIYNRNEINIGAILNGVKGVHEVSNGKYCLILYDDDYLIDSTYISSAVLLLENRPDVVYAFGGVFHNDLIDRKIRRVISNQPQLVNGHDFLLNFKSDKYPIMPSTNTILFRRDIAVKYRCLQASPNAVAGDMLFQLRMLFHGNVGFIRKVAVVYNLHAGSMSRNLNNRIVDANDNGGEKAVATASDDIKELTMIYEDAVKTYHLGKEIMDTWLLNRVYNYLYWRFNETVKTRNEINALLLFVKKEYPIFYGTFITFTADKYGAA